MPLPSETMAQIKEQIKLAEAALKELTPELEKAMRAGVDVTEQTKEAESLKQQIRQLKAVYGR